MYPFVSIHYLRADGWNQFLTLQDLVAEQSLRKFAKNMSPRVWGLCDMNQLVDSALKSIHGPLILMIPNSKSLVFWTHYNISVNVSRTETSFSTFSCFEHQFFSWGRVLYLRRIISVSVWYQRLLTACLFVVGSLHTCKSILCLGFHPLKVLYSHHESFFVKQSTINAWVHMG